MKTTTFAIVLSVLVISSICQDSKGKSVQSDPSQFQGKGGVGASGDPSQFQGKGKGGVGASGDQSQFQGKGGVGASGDQSQFQGKGGKTPVIPNIIPAVAATMKNKGVAYSRVWSHRRVRASHRLRSNY